jgi:hypothetical protein
MTTFAHRLHGQLVWVSPDALSGKAGLSIPIPSATQSGPFWQALGDEAELLLDSFRMGDHTGPISINSTA